MDIFLLFVKLMLQYRPAGRIDLDALASHFAPCRVEGVETDIPAGAGMQPWIGVRENFVERFASRGSDKRHFFTFSCTESGQKCRNIDIRL